MLPGRQQAKPSLCLKQVDHWQTPLHPFCIFINLLIYIYISAWTKDCLWLDHQFFQHYCLRSALIDTQRFFDKKTHLYFGFGPAVVDVNDGEHIPAQRWRRLREYWYCYHIDIDIVIDIDDMRWYWLILPLAWLELIFDTVLVAFPFHLGMILWCDDDYSDDHHVLD